MKPNLDICYMCRKNTNTVMGTNIQEFIKTVSEGNLMWCSTGFIIKINDIPNNCLYRMEQILIKT